MAQAESEVEPDSVTDYVRWESMTLISIHGPILAIPGSYVGNNIARALKLDTKNHPMYCRHGTKFHSTHLKRLH
jgi:hypothetical protein